MTANAGQGDGAGRDQAGAGPENAIFGDARIWGPVVQGRDIHGGVHLHAPAPAKPPVPRQLPPVSAHFVNRDTELAGLDALRAAHPSGTPQLIVLSGPAGVGKTALAARWLARRAGDFPDGQFYVDLGGHSASGPRPPGDALEHFLRSLGAAELPSGTAERSALWRSVTAESSVALLLDNALSAAQVRPLWPAGPGSVVVVTSRHRLTGLVVDGASLQQLEVLEPAAAVELLHRGGGGSRVRDEATAALEVVRLCACLPLALCLAAAQLAARPQQPVARTARALARGRGPLETLRVEGEAAIHTALDASYRLLDAPEAGLYRLLGTLPTGWFSVEMVAAAAALPPEEAEARLEVLVDASLLEARGPDGYRFHDLVAAHARQLADAEDGPAGDPEDGDADDGAEDCAEDGAEDGGDAAGGAAARRALRRFVDWCLGTATAAEAVLTPSRRTMDRDYHHPPPATAPFDTDEEALAWLERHRDTLLATARRCAALGWENACWQLVDSCWPLFLRLRPAELWIEAHELGLEAARRAGHRAGESRMLTSGGNGLRNAGRPDEAAAWYRRALQLATEDGDRGQQAQALNGLGQAHLQAGRLDAAEECLRRALAVREEIGYARGVALTQLGLGQVLLRRGEPAEAARRLATARDGLLAVADGYDAARALALLGQADGLAGDHATGERRLREALAELTAAGSRPWQGRAMELLAEAAERQGDAARARTWYRRAVEHYRAFSPGDAERLAGRLGHR